MQVFANFFYIIAAILFIVGIKLLTRIELARMGNLVSCAGMLIAILATLGNKNILSYRLIFIALAVGSVIGSILSHRAKMIHMPELVALLNGFGGLASTLVGLAEFHKISSCGWARYCHVSDINYFPGALVATKLAMLMAVFVGAVTFSGSLIAYLKLANKTSPPAIRLNKFINPSLGILIAIAAVFFVKNGTCELIYVVAVFSFLLGITGSLPIGGGDMPVVISLLNSLSGLAVAATGFVVINLVLIVVGSLVGASGMVLTIIMCKAMNRHLVNVLFNHFGYQPPVPDVSDVLTKEITYHDAVYILEAAKSAIIVPGYGMAVAQAQHVIKTLADLMSSNGTDVKYAIHPVAGRMPGHMNVLLAEADVSYDQMIDIDDANRMLPATDLAIVIGANDVVNVAAINDNKSPIYGMPIINVHLARSVVVLKRGSGSGFSGITNKLFAMPNVRMLYGDAKATISDIISNFKDTR